MFARTPTDALSGESAGRPRAPAACVASAGVPACALRWAVGSSGCVGAVARVRRFRPEKFFLRVAPRPVAHPVPIALHASNAFITGRGSVAGPTASDGRPRPTRPRVCVSAVSFVRGAAAAVRPRSKALVEDPKAVNSMGLDLAQVQTVLMPTDAAQPAASGSGQHEQRRAVWLEHL